MGIILILHTLVIICVILLFIPYMRREAVPTEIIGIFAFELSGDKMGPQLQLSSRYGVWADSQIYCLNLFQGQRKLPPVYIGLSHVLFNKIYKTTGFNSCYGKLIE